MLVEAFAGEEDLYLLEQKFHYTYASPVRRLRHRLVVVPQAVHGSQYRFDHGLTVSGERPRMTVTSDSFSNHVVELRASTVAEWIEFDAWALVGCQGSGGVVELPSTSIGHRHLLAPTSLTQATETLSEAARELSAAGSGGLDLAERDAVGPPSPDLPIRCHRRTHQRRDGPRCGKGRMPGLCPCDARSVSDGWPSRPLRVGAPDGRRGFARLGGSGGRRSVGPGHQSFGRSGPRPYSQPPCESGLLHRGRGT